MINEQKCFTTSINSGGGGVEGFSQFGQCLYLSFFFVVVVNNIVDKFMLVMNSPSQTKKMLKLQRSDSKIQPKPFINEARESSLVP